MELPPGVPDPMFMCELALELHMPVGEMAGRMSAHELGVMWPAFFRARDRERAREQQTEDMKRGRRR